MGGHKWGRGDDISVGGRGGTEGEGRERVVVKGEREEV